jgi:hypothetical protein
MKAILPLSRRRKIMRRTTLTLLTMVAVTLIWAGTAQANTTVTIATGLASQTVAKPWHGGRHYGPKHHGHHYKHYYGHRGHHRRMHIYHPPVYVAPPIYYGGYGYNHGGLYFGGRNFSFGINY